MTCYWFLLCCFFFVGWKLECKKKIHDPSEMVAEFYAAPHFQLHKKVWSRPDLHQHPLPPPPPPPHTHTHTLNNRSLTYLTSKNLIRVSRFKLRLEIFLLSWNFNLMHSHFKMNDWTVVVTCSTMLLTGKVKGQKKNAIFRHRFRRKNLSYRCLTFCVDPDSLTGVIICSKISYFIYDVAGDVEVLALICRKSA